MHRLLLVLAGCLSLSVTVYRPLVAQEVPAAAAGREVSSSPTADGTTPPANPGSEPGGAADAQPPVEEASLSSDQEALTARYQRFENTLLQLAEYLRKTDPERAELLVRALGRSKEGRIPDQMVLLVELLKRDQLGDAIERQDDVMLQMGALLELLQSEDRRDEIEQEKQRLTGLIKDVNKLIGKQRDVRAATERNAPGDRLERDQQQVAEGTGNLADKIAEQDRQKAARAGQNGEPKSAADGPDSSGDSSQQGGPVAGDQQSRDPANPDKSAKPSDADAEQSGKPSDSSGPPSEGAQSPAGQQGQSGEQGQSPQDPGKSPGDQPQDPQQPAGKQGQPDTERPESSPSDEQGGESESSEGEPQSGKPKPGKGKNSPSQSQGGQSQSPSESGEEGESSEGGSSEPQEQGPPSSRQKTPGREEIARARDEMDRAIQELKRKNREGASNKQDAAIAELIKAKEQLEEILRQLREEERQLVLAQLESRFRDMLARQTTIYNATVGLDGVPEDQRNDRQRTRAVQLARSEDEIVLLADKALTLLREAGESVAFPQAVEQVRDDMRTVSRRLERVETGEITQTIEKEILESLEELVEALQKELEKSKDRQQQKQQQQQQQGNQEQGLIDSLAELKMLRQLQFRINRRTRSLGRMVDGEQADDPDVRQQLRELSARQQKIRQGAYELATGKNQ